MAIAYLAYPGLHYLNLFDLKPYVLTLPFLLFAYYFWDKDDFKGFICSILPVFLFTEVVSAIIIMFGITAGLESRNVFQWTVFGLIIFHFTMIAGYKLDFFNVIWFNSIVIFNLIVL